MSRNLGCGSTFISFSADFMQARAACPLTDTTQARQKPLVQAQR